MIGAPSNALQYLYHADGADSGVTTLLGVNKIVFRNIFEDIKKFYPVGIFVSLIYGECLWISGFLGRIDHYQVFVLC